MTIIRLTAQRDQCAQVKTEYGEVVVSHGWARNPEIGGSIRMTPEEAGVLVDAINAALEGLAESDRLAGRVR